MNKMLMNSSLFLVLVFVVKVQALACFENDMSKTKLTMRNSSSIKYCVAARKSPNFWTESRLNLFSVDKDEDQTEAYDQIFGGNSKRYKVFTVCIMEKYDFGELLGEEFSFRCMCNFDRCNKAFYVKSYMKRIYRQNRYY